ncbi:uncharacterized protein [Cherax quadricarinatus]|uniref:uncharacterized protein n=1 Tax=Cherax quadricarinatus TaxID=27406 RepID=UPI00387EE571
MICALLAAVITTVACEHFIRNDGMPIIYGGNNDTNMARSPGLLVVSPAPPQTQPLIPTVSANSAIQFVSPRDQQINQQPRFVGPITHRVTNQLPHHAAPLEPATNQFPRFGETQGVSNQQFTAPREQITNSIQFPAPLVKSQPSNTQQITNHHPGLSFIQRPQVFHDLRQPTYVCDPLAKPLVDEVYDGKAYHFSWCHDCGRSYTWLTAVYYCAGLGNGFQPVSLESRREQDFISTIIIQHYISDVWTSGNTISSSSWTWLSGASSAYTLAGEASLNPITTKVTSSAWLCLITTTTTVLHGTTQTATIKDALYARQHNSMVYKITFYFGLLSYFFALLRLK